jgi:WD40 repeat protein
VESGQQIRELSVPGATPYSARMNSAFPDKWVIMGDSAGRLYAWDLPRNRIITNSKFHDGAIHSVGYQPGGKGAYFSGGADGLLKVRMPMGERYSVSAHTGVMYQAHYSSSGELLYTAGKDRKVKVWETAKLKQQRARTVMEGHLKYVLAADMSLDERLLATGGGDKAIYIWEVATGKLLAHLQGHTSDVEAIAFAPNGKFVVSASEDKTVRIWSVENREELVRLFFQTNGEKYAGVTIDNDTFGDRDSGLVSIYVDGRQVSGAEAERFVRYIGRGIAILDSSAN